MTADETPDPQHLCDTVSHSAAEPSRSSEADPRAVKSAQALRNALLALLERKPFEQITVREIAAEAGIHYATFFRHHATKEALLDHVAADQIDRLVELALPVLDRADSYAAVLALCRYVEAHRVLWTTLLTGGAAGAMREELLGIAKGLAVERASENGWLPVALAVKCAVSMIFETLAWWLSEGGDAGTEPVAAILHRLLSAIQDLDERLRPA